MSRSFWKPPYIKYNLVNDVLSKKNNIKTKSRSSIILQSFIGSVLFVYTGRMYKKIIITENMVGHKLGEFAFTRKIGRIHMKKKKKKR